jgi:hypothetical protein
MQRSLVFFVAFLATLAFADDAPTYSHFVRPDGNPSSACSQAEPCTLARAFVLAATPAMPCGSVVQVAAGYYVQDVLVYNSSRSCSAGTYVKLIGDEGAVVTGLATAPAAPSFRRENGRAYTYVVDWNEADPGKFPVKVVAQRATSRWESVTVEDRFPPFDVESETQFELDLPIGYTERSTIAAVEQHRCTFWNDTAANKVYVHMCHNRSPESADDLHFGRERWGNVIVQGDGLWWENIDIRHVSRIGVGFGIEPTADRTALMRSAFRSAGAELGGTNTLAEDMDFGYMIEQGDAGPDCFDADSNTSGTNAQSCFNSRGNGRALMVGVVRSAASFGQTIRRARVHRSWNGGTLAGANTIENSVFWGFPNHSLEATGTGGVIRDTISANAQDSIYLSAYPFDRLTIENNLFLHDAVFWTSYNQDGGTPTTSWKFRNNIGVGLLIEDLTYQGLASNCNLWIRNYRGSDNGFVSFDNPSYSGGAVFSHASLAALRDGHPGLDRDSVQLPASKWTDGTQFVNFVSQRHPTFSFDPAGPSAAALNMSACGRVGPSPSILPEPPRNLRVTRSP